MYPCFHIYVFIYSIFHFLSFLFFIFFIFFFAIIEKFIYIFDHNSIIIDEIKEVRLGYSFFLPCFTFLLYIYITLYSFVMIKKCLFIFSWVRYSMKYGKRLGQLSIVFYFSIFTSLVHFIYLFNDLVNERKIELFLISIFFNLLTSHYIPSSRFFEIIYTYIHEYLKFKFWIVIIHL